MSIKFPGGLRADANPRDRRATISSMPTKQTTSSGRRRSRGAQLRARDITTWRSAERYLLERTDFERMRVVRVTEEIFKLDRMRHFMEAWGNPQEQVRFVHVAGSVGKGSTVAMIASMLRGCGSTVGVFTSPHLTEMRERIMINEQMISRSEFQELVKQAAKLVEKTGIEPTYFELMTAIAFKYYAEQAVDIAVMETGLGGRLDSTNIITPEVCAITAIAHDHNAILGETLEEIAAEKAGIMKRGVPCLTFNQDAAILDVLKKHAEEVGAPLMVVGEDIEFSRRFNAGADSGPQSRICVIMPERQFMHLPVPLPGEHQALNCGLAIAVTQTLAGSGFKCPEDKMLEGLLSTRTPGRMEVISEVPRILVDGAHNPASLAALMRGVGSHVAYDSMVCIFGCCEDKDVDGMLEMAALGGDKFIFTKARHNPRAADPDELQQRFAGVSGKMSQVADNLTDALDLATRAVAREDIICITGSFYLVGEAKRLVQQKLAAEAAARRR